MLRYRRYRVFIFIALFAVVAVYQFGRGSDWEDDALAYTDYAATKVRQQLGLRAGSSDAAIGEELSKKQEESAQLPMQYTHGDAADLPPNTGNLARPATDKLPKGAVNEKGPTHEDDDAWKPNPGASLPDKTSQLEQESKEKERQRVQPGPTEPMDDQYVPEAKDGQGRKDTDLDTGNLNVHWSKTSERFPVTSTITLPAGTPKALPKIQHAFPNDDKDGVADVEKLKVIKEAFEHAWQGYKAKAYGHDEVRPITGNPRNPFNGWGATLIDSLDSLWIFGMTSEFEEAVKHVGTVDFTTSPRADIPLFETTIRYLGGLLSAYDISDAKYPVLLEKAKQLGDVLYAAFDTPNRMPQLFYQWKPAFATQIHRASTHAVMSELGSLSLEFTRLAQLTKENKYYDAIARITNGFQEWQNNTKNPGMWPIHLDASGCERVRTSTPTSQKIGDSSVERLDSSTVAGKVPLDTKDGAKMVPVEQPDSYKFAVGGTGSASGQANPAAGVPAQSEDSLSEPDVNEKEFVPLKKPEPFVFKSGPQAGKVGQIQVIDSAAGATHGDEKEGVKEDPRQHIDAAAALDDSNEKSLPGGKVGQIKYVELGTDGKERPRQKNTDRDTTGALEDSTDPMDAAVAGMYANSYGAHEKRDAEKPKLMKRQELSHKEEKGPMGTIPVAPEGDAAPQGQRTTIYNDDVCTERGLASMSKYGKDEFSLGSMADSTYEYLPKEYILLGGLNDQYRTMYEKAINRATEVNIFRPMLPRELDILLAGNYYVHHANEEHGGAYTATFHAASSHLVCFVGGMYGLSAKIFDRPQDLEIAEKLTNGCVWAYESTATGIMPESFEVIACDTKEKCAWNESKYWDALDPNSENRFRIYDNQMANLEKEEQQERLEVAAAAGDIDAKVQMEQDRRHQNQRTDLASREKEEKVVPPLPVTGGSAPAAVGKIVKRATEAVSKLVKRQNIAPAKEAAKDDFAEIAGKVDLAATPTSGGAAKSASTPGKVTKFRPQKPLDHETYVKSRIEREKLPPGMVGMLDRRYILRPEAIESVFYMHRLTGKPHWREKGWSMFQAIEKHTRTEYGHSAIDDVMKQEPGKDDSQESFWLAETLKYFYLLFEDSEKWSLDEWVYNTEAHPFRRPGSKGGWQGT